MSQNSQLQTIQIAQLEKKIIEYQGEVNVLSKNLNDERIKR